jgi:hypothetical protein
MNTSSTRNLESLLVELLDREAIRDCLYRYCRGIDRADVESLRSSYWPNAYDRHGAYVGPAEGFIELAQKVFKTDSRMVHQVSNILIEFKGPTRAAVESYFHALQRGPRAGGETEQVLLAGRYCDLFEKRGQEWRVLNRTVVYDWMEPQTVPSLSEDERFGARKPIGAAFPTDPSYALFSK